jgi:hypothetical protein
MDSQQKQCSCCGIAKNLSEFSNWCKSKDKLRPTCRKCQSNKKKKYLSGNPAIEQTNKMFNQARIRAKNKNLPFDLDLEFIRSLITSHCPIFNLPLEWSLCRSKLKGPLDNSPSLDRIDPSKGYVKGNVWIISQKANRIKNNATHEELKLVTEAVGRAIVDSLDW